MSGTGSPSSEESLFIKPPWIERTRFLDVGLSRITTIYPGEGLSAVLLACVVFVLLMSFYVLKTVRETLILQSGGAEVKSYAAAAQSLLLVVVVPAYGLIASKLDRVRLITSVNLFFLSHVLLFAALCARNVPIAVPFYLWLGVYNVMVIAQFWAFATDVYSTEQGKRLFPIVGAGSALGALAGARASSPVLHSFGLPGAFLLVALLVSAAIIGIAMVNRFVCSCGGPQSVIAHLPIGRDGGFQLLLRSRYLMLVAVLTLLVNLTSSSGEFLVGKMVADAASAIPFENRGGFIAGYYSDYFTVVSAAAFVLQIAVVPRAFERLGVTGSLFVLPALSLASSGVTFLTMALPALRAFKAAENSVEYSLQSTASHALLLGANRAAKYKAKSAIDAFFFRTGDLILAGIVSAGTALAFSIREYALVNVVLAGLWFAVVLALHREKKRQPRRWTISAGA